MRVLVLGGSGVIGRSLIPLLCRHGHDVLATGRSSNALEVVRRLGAEPIRADGADQAQIVAAIEASGADVLINQMTSLPDAFSNVRSVARAAKVNDRLRGETGPVAIDAATRAGIGRVISQSVAFACPPSPKVLRGDEPLWVDAPSPFGKANTALAALEAATRQADGIVLRYGAIYGPGTYYGPGGAFTNMIAKRRFPIIGRGQGVYGFVHLDDVATATVAALDAEPGTYPIVDDTAVTAAEWLDEAARALDAKPPRRLPRWMAVGPAAALRYIIDDQPSVSNQRAKDQLGWSPSHPSWEPDLIDSMIASAD